MSNNLRFDIEHLKSAIDALLVSCPELAEDEILRTDMLEAETDLNEILRMIVSRIQDLDAFSEAINCRTAGLRARQDRYERGMEGLRSLAQLLMERGNLNKVILPEATLSVSYRKGTPFVLNDEAVPDECCVVTRKASLTKIKGWIEAHDGQLPSGTSMSNGKQVLTIRSK